MKASEALQHHQNLIFRRSLEKLQAEQPLDDEELKELNRRAGEESKGKPRKKEPKKAGRRPKLTRELIGKIRNLIAAGNTARAACLACRISETSYYEWQTKDSRNPLFAEFSEAIKEATAESEINAVAKIMGAMRDNWTATAWFLERRFPETWGRKDMLKAEHSGPNGTPLPSQNQIVVYIPDNGRAIQPNEPQKLSNGA